MYELHDFARSTAAYRVRIALALKGISHDVHDVDLNAGAQHDPEFRSLNPQGMVPVYSDEQVLLSQSLAIIEYLDERYPQPPLLPQGLVARARVRQFAHLISADIHALNAHRVHSYLRDTLRADTAARRQWFGHWLYEGLDALELWLAAGPAGRYCVGDAVTMADLCLVPQLEIARRNRIDVDDFPRLCAIEAACLALDAFRGAAPATGNSG